jgi:hypothetical protein
MFAFLKAAQGYSSPQVGTACSEGSDEGYIVVIRLVIHAAIDR